ncbi:MAG: hypothetical protein F6K55_24050 [Moorea sp. SIO4A3]|nr:hypothetical protein [Moorena sp. SIO4A3]
MAFNWPVEELTVRGKVGIGTDTPSQELEVIGDISATNLTLQGSLTIDENLSVGGNFQLGTLSINAFSSDGNLADNSNLAVPTEQAVKTYVDNEITQVNNALDTKADLNGATNQNFSSKNLSVSGNLRVSGNLEVQGDVIARDTEHIAGNVSLGDQDTDEVKITGVIRSGHSSGSLRIDDALHTTGSLTVDGSLSVSNAIATANVGIGTNSPRAKLHIYSPGSNDALKISNPKVNKNARMGVDQLGVFIEPSEDDSSIRLNANPRSLGIVIRGTNGNVGIGTRYPRAKLDVNGRLFLRAGLDFGGTAEDGYGTVGMITWSSDKNFVIFGREGYGLKLGANLKSANSNLYALNITTEGNVGLGIKAPRAKLDVSGDIKSTGKLSSQEQLSSQDGKVRRDFVTWNTRVGTSNPIHIKTNIPKKSNFMYRILVEGYNYGVGAAINSDVVGYTYQRWEIIGHAQANDYANGVSISQYYSSDGYVVIKLTTSNTFHIGFSASAWLTNPNGTGFDISATVHHQAGDL